MFSSDGQTTDVKWCKWTMLPSKLHEGLKLRWKYSTCEVVTLKQAGEGGVVTGLLPEGDYSEPRDWAGSPTMCCVFCCHEVTSEGMGCAEIWKTEKKIWFQPFLGCEYLESKIHHKNKIANTTSWPSNSAPLQMDMYHFLSRNMVISTCFSDKLISFKPGL